MNFHPNQNNSVNSVVNEVVDCSICLEKIVVDNPNCINEEKPRKLDCSHLFHRECIGWWLETKNSCPLCRVVIDANRPAAGPSEMSLEEILAVPDHQGQPPIQQENDQHLLFVIRENILETRRVRRINLNGNSQQELTANKVNSVALQFLGDFN